MNWVDFVLIGIVLIAALMGMKIGIIEAVFNVISVLVGWLLAGQFSDDVGALFGDSLSNDTIVTVISYAIIVIVAQIASRFVAKIVKPLRQSIEKLCRGTCSFRTTETFGERLVMLKKWMASKP